MSKSFEKYEVNLKEEKNIQNLVYCHKIYKDLLIVDEKGNIILYDLKLEKKILDITIHDSHFITSIHICKKPLYIDDEELTFSNNSFFFLLSLKDKLALYQIPYNNLTSEYSNYKLIAQSQSIKFLINNIIQIENGQIVISGISNIMLLNNRIKNGKLEKLFEIDEYSQYSRIISIISVFEIKNNLIQVSLEFYDEYYDELNEEEKLMEKNYIDGIYIYSIDSNKIIKKKKLDGIAKLLDVPQKVRGKYSYVVMKDKLILRIYKEIIVYNLNNLDYIFKFTVDVDPFDIYPFNEKYFMVFYKEGSKAIFKLYNINTMKNVQAIEVFAKSNIYNLFPISNNEYVLDNSIATIDKIK